MVAPASSQSLTILIVEDEAIVAVDIESCLKRAGYSVIGVADNARDALAMAAAKRPDLALVDIRIKGNMDGVELAGRLRSELHVPVVFATAHADVETVRRASATEPFGYVVKPFDEQSLRVAVEISYARHQAETRARELERWFATTLHSIGDAVIATDRTGRINLMNERAESLTGWSRAEALGKPLAEVFVLSLPEEPQLPSRLLSQVVDRGMAFHVHGDAWLGTKTGGRLPIDDSIAPIRDDRGLITGLVVVFRDRTQMLEAEEQRRQLEDKMHQAQRLESLGVLAGGIAHDFNNLLTATFGNAELCRSKLPPSSPLLPYLENIEQAARRGADLCTQMLAYAGKGKFVIKPVDLSGLVRDTVQLLQVSVDKGARLELKLTPDLSAVVGDASKLQQVLMNLVINASEALPEGGGTIVISTSEVVLDAAAIAGLGPNASMSPGRYLKLEVSDTGQGMSEEARRRIFDPFFTTKFQGRGLGLAAVLGILQAHGGGVSVESALGRGTTFKVFLPASTEKWVSGVQVQPLSAIRPGGRVLLADDEDAVRGLTAALLRELGFEVHAVADGAQAVAAVEREPGRYRVALLDVTMPRLGGAEASRRIHALAPGLPIILMSGYNEEATRNQLDQAHVSGFLSKPFSLTDLRSKLAHALRAPEPHVELARS